MNQSNLWKKDSYLDKDISYLVSTEIVEYDMKSAGFNLTKYYKLLDQDKIDYLSTLQKKHQTIQIGLYQKEDKVYRKALKEAFADMRRKFFEANDIQDEDVISIKKDAIFLTRHCQNTEFGNVLFATKNTYSSYYYMGNLELYVGNNKLDVKGIKDDTLPLHDKYMRHTLFEFFKLIESGSFPYAIRQLKEFAEYYKARQIPIGYYREFNSSSRYRIRQDMYNDILGEKTFVLSDNVGDASMLDISYNYLNFIVPLINVLV